MAMGDARASVTVTVVDNRAPVAVDDIGQAHGTGDTRIDVTANDRDPEGDGWCDPAEHPAYGRAQCVGGVLPVSAAGDHPRRSGRLPVR